MWLASRPGPDRGDLPAGPPRNTPGSYTGSRGSKMPPVNRRTHIPAAIDGRICSFSLVVCRAAHRKGTFISVSMHSQGPVPPGNKKKVSDFSGTNSFVMLLTTEQCED